MAPTFGNGKICYLVLPAQEPQVSAAFYAAVFDWNIRRRSNGELSFDDGVGEVSGTWVNGLKPMQGDPLTSGITIHIMVDSAEATIAKVIANGGEIVRPIGADYPEITALFRDPGGNVLGIYQHRGSEVNQEE